MSIVKTNDIYYSDIADAIRAKLGVTTTYKPSQMATAIQDIEVSVKDVYPDLELPSKYREYVDYAMNNLYVGNFAGLMVMDYNDWIAVSFLMSNFTIQTYNSYSTEFTATGWFTCGYTKSTQVWTAHDYRNTVSTGENYAHNIQFASRYIEYNKHILFPKSIDVSSTSGNAIVTTASAHIAPVGAIETKFYLFSPTAIATSYIE